MKYIIIILTISCLLEANTVSKTGKNKNIFIVDKFDDIYSLILEPSISQKEKIILIDTLGYTLDKKSSIFISMFLKNKDLLTKDSLDYIKKRQCMFKVKRVCDVAIEALRVYYYNPFDTNVDNFTEKDYNLQIKKWENYINDKFYKKLKGEKLNNPINVYSQFLNKKTCLKKQVSIINKLGSTTNYRNPILLFMFLENKKDIDKNILKEYNIYNSRRICDIVAEALNNYFNNSFKVNTKNFTKKDFDELIIKWTININKNLFDFKKPNDFMPQKPTLKNPINILLSIDDAYKSCSPIYAMWLQDKKFTSFPKEVLDFSDLISLDLRNNRIKEIPIEIAKLKKLQEIVIDECGLEIIPKEIGALQELTELWLGDNNLKFIPDEFYDLKALKTLRMDKKSLSLLDREKIELLTNLTKVFVDGENISLEKFKEMIPIKENNIENK